LGYGGSPHHPRPWLRNVYHWYTCRLLKTLCCPPPLQVHQWASKDFFNAGRILNVAVCPADTNEPPRVLNYLSSPNVLVWSAVSCSSAFPFLFMPQDLLARNRRGELVK